MKISCSGCSNCDIWFNPFNGDCTYNNCHGSCQTAQGSACYFKGNILGISDCVRLDSFCTSSTKCSDYSSQECANDPCNIGNCAISGGSCVEQTTNMVAYTLKLTNSAGNELSKDSQGRYIISQGSNFIVEVYVDDLVGIKGIFSAYVDLTRSLNTVKFVSSSVVIGGDFSSGQSGLSNTDSTVDEAGGINMNTITANPQLLFKVTATAVSTGTSTFKLESADDTNNHGTLIRGQDNYVSQDKISYGQAILVIS